MMDEQGAEEEITRQKVEAARTNEPNFCTSHVDRVFRTDLVAKLIPAARSGLRLLA